MELLQSKWQLQNANAAIKVTGVGVTVAFAALRVTITVAGTAFKITL